MGATKVTTQYDARSPSLPQQDLPLHLQRRQRQVASVMLAGLVSELQDVPSRPRTAAITNIGNIASTFPFTNPPQILYLQKF